MNTLFLIVTDANGGVAKVTTHENRRDAFTYVNQMCLDRGSYHVVGEPMDLPADGGLTAALRERLKVKASERSVVYNALQSRYQSQEHEVIAPPRVITSLNVREEKSMETQTAETAKPGKAAKATKPAKTNTAKPAKAAAPKVNRAKGKPAGAVADFVPVKDGSKRGEILKLMDGNLDNAGIGAKLGMSAALVGSHIFCLFRDCAIGYAYGEGGKVTALFPKGKDLASALKTAPVPAAPKAKTAAKPAAAKAKPAAKKAAPKADGAAAAA